MSCNKIKIEEDENGLYILKINEKNIDNLYFNYKYILSQIKKIDKCNIEIIGSNSEVIFKRIINEIKLLGLEYKVNKVEIVKKNTKNREITFFNGFKCFISGMYSNEMQYTKLKHLYIDSEEINEDDLKNFCINYSNINSAIIMKNIYEEERYRDKFGISYIAIKEMDKKKNVIIINNNYKKEVIISNLSNFKKDFISINTENIILLDTKEDFQIFKNKIQEINYTGKIHLELISAIIKDECMFASKEKCTLLKGNRIFYSNKNNIWNSNICFQLNINNNNEFNYKKIFKQKYFKGYIEKKCYQCKSQHICPKCIRLSNNKEINKIYCSIINNEFTRDFIKIRNILKSFIKYEEMRGLIIVSTPKYRMFYRENKNKKINYSKYLIFQYKENIYLFVNQTLKFYQINRIIATWLEAYQIEEETFKIKEYYCNVLGFNYKDYEKLEDKISMFCKRINISLEEKKYE